MRKVLVLLLVITSLTPYANEDKIDSLMKAASTAVPEEKAALYNQIAYLSYRTHPALTKEYALKAFQIATKNEFNHIQLESELNLGLYYIVVGKLDSSRVLFKGVLHKSKQQQDISIQAQALNRLGVLYYITGNTDTSLLYYEAALPLFKKLGNDEEQSKVSSNIGSIYYRKGNFEAALQQYLQCVEIDTKMNSKDGLASDYVNISNIFFELKNYSKSISYAQQSLQLYKELEDTKGVLICCINLSNNYQHLQEYENALMYVDRAIALSNETDDQHNLGISLNSKGTILQKMNRHAEALDVLEKSLEIKRIYHDEKGIASTLGNIGAALKDLNREKEAIIRLNESNDISLKHHLYEYLMNNHLNLHALYKKLGNLKEAERHLMDSYSFKDSVFQASLKSTVHELETKYETTKKEKENVILKSKNQLQEAEIAQKEAEKGQQLLLFIGLGLVLVLIFSFFLYRRKLMEKAKLNALEKTRFKAVIEAEEKERVRIARELHDGLGQLLSTAKLNVAGLEESVDKEDELLVKNSMTLIDDAVTEVRNISHNMMPAALTTSGLMPALTQLVSKIQQSGQLQVEFTNQQLEDRLDSSIEIAVYRVIQEVFNNMIKHAKASQITLSVFKKENNLYVRISDNGIGFDTNKLDESKGIGWKNIFSRVSLLNGIVDVHSSRGKGTNVEIKIPV